MVGKGALSRRRPDSKKRATELEEQIKQDTGSVQGSANDRTVEKKHESPSLKKKQEKKTPRKSLSKEGIDQVFGKSVYEKGDKQTALISNKNRRRLKLLADCLPGVTMQDLTDNILDHFWQAHSDKLKEITEL